MKVIATILWSIAKISPTMGNFVMDLIGEERYDKIAHIMTRV